MPKEKLLNCPECHSKDSLTRKINKVFIRKQDSDHSADVGDLTKEFITENFKDYKARYINVT